MTRTCPACAEPAPDGAAWCEACGADLGAEAGAALPASIDEPDAAVVIPPAPSAAESPTAAEPCVACGAGPADITHDGWCQQCGQRQPSPRDHELVDHGWVAGVSDKGKAHHQNEDAMAMWIGDQPGQTVIVVCDGVSSTELPEEASTAAASASLDLLQPVAEFGSVSDADFAAATEAAKARVAAVWRSSSKSADPPSCTLVAAATSQSESSVLVKVAWLGDSRAYWFGEGSAELLTTDHSWAEQQRELGTLDESVIASDPRAHSITRWIGLDAGDVTPEVREFTFEAPGRLVVCSDGLWNYAATAETLAAAVVAGSSEETEAELAERLTAFANDGGGHDNITVVTARFERAGDTDAVTADDGDGDGDDTEERSDTAERSDTEERSDTDERSDTEERSDKERSDTERSDKERSDTEQLETGAEGSG